MLCELKTRNETKSGKLYKKAKKRWSEKERKRERVNGEGRNAEVEKEKENQLLSPISLVYLQSSVIRASRPKKARGENIDRGVGPFNFAV